MQTTKKTIHRLIRQLLRINHLSKRYSRASEVKKDSKMSRSDLSRLLGMDYRRFSHLLPYRYFDEKDRLFINTESIGFALEVAL